MATQTTSAETVSAKSLCYKQILANFHSFQNPSFVLRAVRDVAFEDRPVPTLRGPKDVRVHIAQTGICGSDVSLLS
jgi:hypothetical protein